MLLLHISQNLRINNVGFSEWLLNHRISNQVETAAVLSARWLH